jgi:hypothetical protein
MRDGHLNKCKECTCADVRANRQANRHYYIEVDRQRAMRPDRVESRRAYARSPHGRRVTRAIKEAWASRNPEKRRAEWAVNNAIRDGRLHRQPCDVCGAKAQGHHPDYTKPLDVQWLCPAHHKAEHRRMREEVA